MSKSQDKSLSPRNNQKEEQRDSKEMVKKESSKRDINKQVEEKKDDK